MAAIATEPPLRSSSGRAPGEPRWPASLAVVGALALYLTLPDRLIPGPAPARWVLPVLESALVVPLTITSPTRLNRESRASRAAAVVLIALVNLANFVSLGLLVQGIVAGQTRASGRTLIVSAVQIWMTNVLVFALWYWELDRGGPVGRARGDVAVPDFLFPQAVTPEIAPRGWAPRFVDYLYLSFTNSTAFSPTDTMPLSGWAKMAMLAQSLAALLTVAVVAARAVNILHG